MLFFVIISKKVTRLRLVNGRYLMQILVFVMNYGSTVSVQVSPLSERQVVLTAAATEIAAGPSRRELGTRSHRPYGHPCTGKDSIKVEGTYEHLRYRC